MLETKAGVLFIAGLGFFGLAFLSNAVVPVLMYRDLPEQTVEQSSDQRQPAVPVRRPGPAVPRQLHGRLRQAPRGASQSARSGSTRSRDEALRLGHKVYVGRGVLALPQPVRPPRLQRGPAVRARCRRPRNTRTSSSVP